MREVIQRILSSKDMAITRFAKRDRIHAMIRALHPIVTNKPLVRLGGADDGGYLVPDDLEGIAACFSPGVDVVASFEKDVADKGIPCFLADASVDGPPINDDRLHFDRKFLGVWNDDITVTLDNWVAQHAPAGGDLLLQMDIEGAEWPVLLNVSDETLARFRIIVLEVHAFQKMLEWEIFPIMEASLGRLMRMFHVVHNHPNNAHAELNMGSGLIVPRLFELTLLRKDRAASIGFANAFPHPLDRANVPSKPDLTLPPNWFRQSI